MEEKYWILHNLKTQQNIKIGKEVVRAGRSNQFEITCFSANVSRNHAIFVPYPDGTLHVQDQNSSNGTFINNVRIPKNKFHQLHLNDEVGLGLHSRLQLPETVEIDFNYIYIVKRSVSPLPSCPGKLTGDINKTQKNDMKIACARVNLDSCNGNYEESLPGEKCTTVNVKIEPEIENDNNNVEYTIDDGCIVINDDDDFPCSQLLDNFNPNKPNNGGGVSESIFCAIKKELEDIHHDDAIQYVNLECSDDMNENLQSLLEDDVEEKSANDAMNAVPESRKSSVDYKKAEKRKSEERENETHKKIKTGEFYSKKNDLKSKRSTNISKEDINAIRKRKLKELANKTKEDKEEKIKVVKPCSTTKIKVSHSTRGDFLTEINDKPSTSKQQSRLPKTRRKPSKSVPATVTAKNGDLGKNDSRKSPTPLLPTARIPLLNKNVIPVSQSRSHQIYRNFKDIEDIMLHMLNWKAIWFDSPNDQTQWILTSLPLSRMTNQFSNYSEYYKTVRPLLELELWNYINKGVEDTHDPRKTKFLAKITNERKMPNYTELECFSYITNEQNDKFLFIKEEDAVVLQFYIMQSNQKITIPFLGYVSEVSRKVLRGKDLIDIDFAQAVMFKPFGEVRFKVLLQSYMGSVLMDTFMRIRIVASLTPTTRLIKSVKYLEHSVLSQHILRPTVDLYKLTNVKKEKIVSQDNLNPSQYYAVMEATHVYLRRKPGIYLILGPPGTGKSTVIVNIIQQILFRELTGNSMKGCLLVVAPSNAAVDEIVLRMIKIKAKFNADQRKQIRLVRSGPSNMISPLVEEYSLHEMAKRNTIPRLLKDNNSNDCKQLRTMHQDVVKLKETCDTPEAKLVYYSAKAEFEKKCRSVFGRTYNDTIKKREDELLQGASIICTTLSSCVGTRMLDAFANSSNKINFCIVDEATQSSEQETLIPLTLGISKLILVGDPKQLPAVTLSKVLTNSREAKDYAYGQSLFSRIASYFEGKPKNPIRLLNVQYRMHPAICQYPNYNYYDGKIKDAPEVKTRSSPLNLKPYLVFNLKTQFFSSQEYSNRAEIECVIRLLDAIVLTNNESCDYSIGIITPYNNQKDGIKSTIKKKTYKSNVLIAVNTIDSFQGQEKDVIIMSCVRDYSNNFLRDEQRLNVAMTRAKHALYIMGSQNLFKTCTVLGRIYDDAKQRDLMAHVSHNTTTSALLQMIQHASKQKRQS